MAAFEYRQAEEVRDSFARLNVRYLFIGKSAAILLGFPDTTQDADLFVEKSVENGRAIVVALRALGFTLSDAEAAEIERGKDFIQLKNGPFDLDLIFAPDGIESFQDAWIVRLLASIEWHRNAGLEFVKNRRDCYLSPRPPTVSSAPRPRFLNKCLQLRLAGHSSPKANSAQLRSSLHAVRAQSRRLCLKC
ncbi:MAG: hypothetical protein O2856_10800 [Planctomycetota bacterium]|nr:hypothetical protein [Planctomycetota bacterium]